MPISFSIAEADLFPNVLVDLTVRVKGKQHTIIKRMTVKTSHAQEPNKYIETLFMDFLYCVY
jgi:hypothetical protein